jgi:3-oxoacyl-[acyl-carrier-protein] synthase II
MRRRVVITGIGPMTAFGTGIGPLWDAMLEGRSAVGPITRFDASNFSCTVAAEIMPDQFRVRDVVPKSYRKAMKVMCSDVELAIGAADAAVRDAGLITQALDPKETPTIPPHRMGCHIGAGLIAADIEELTAAMWNCRENGRVDLEQWGDGGMENLTPLWLLKYLPNMLACHVTIIHDCQGPSNTITCAEASAALSIGESMRVIERSAADVCLSGGAEDKLNPMGLIRQHFAGRLAPCNGDGDGPTVVKPFDPNASGTVLGVGGGILVLEAHESAVQRGARAYAEIAGFAATQSFCPDTVGMSPDPEGTSIADAIAFALADAGIAPKDVDMVVPMGLGIPAFDHAEAAALQTVFGQDAQNIPLVTVVPHVGNCCAGSTGISLSIAAQCIFEQKIPARINSAGMDGLQAAAAPAADHKIRHAVVLSSSLGGQNAAIVLRRMDA